MARLEKYIANRAEKNISSDDNHTMVPTLTRFGRVNDPCAGIFSSAEAVATAHIVPDPPCASTRRSRRAARPVRGLPWGRADASRARRAPVTAGALPPLLAHGQAEAPFSVGQVLAESHLDVFPGLPL